MCGYSEVSPFKVCKVGQPASFIIVVMMMMLCVKTKNARGL